MYLLRCFKVLIRQFMKWEEPQNILLFCQTDVLRTTNISYLTWKNLPLAILNYLTHFSVLSNAMHVRREGSAVCMREEDKYMRKAEELKTGLQGGYDLYLLVKNLAYTLINSRIIIPYTFHWSYIDFPKEERYLCLDKWKWQFLTFPNF